MKKSLPIEVSTLIYNYSHNIYFLCLYNQVNEKKIKELNQQYLIYINNKYDEKYNISFYTCEQYINDTKYQKLIEIIKYQKNIIANLIYFNMLDIFDELSPINSFENNDFLNSLYIYDTLNNYSLFLHYFEIINSYIIHFSLYYASQLNSIKEKNYKYNNINRMFCIERVYLCYLIENKNNILIKYNLEENIYDNILKHLFSLPCSYVIPYYMQSDYDYAKLHYIFGDIFNIEKYFNYFLISFISSTNVINHIYEIVDFERTISQYNINKYDNCLWFRNGLKYNYYNSNYSNLTTYLFVNSSIIYDKILLNIDINKDIYNIVKCTMNSMRRCNSFRYKNFINENLIICGFLNYNTLEHLLNNGNLFNYIDITVYNLGYVDLLQYTLLLNNDIFYLKRYLSQLIKASSCRPANFIDVISLSKIFYNSDYKHIKNMFLPTIELLVIHKHYIKLIEYMSLIYENNFMVVLINLFRMIIFLFRVNDKNVLSVLRYYSKQLIKNKPSLILFNKTDIDKPILNFEENLIITDGYFYY